MNLADRLAGAAWDVMVSTYGIAMDWQPLDGAERVHLGPEQGRQLVDLG